MANNQQFMEGKTITTALSAAMASGQLTAIGKMVGVANLTTAANEANVYSVEGVFLVPKKKTDDVTVGALLYLDADGKSVTTTAGTQYVGVAWRPPPMASRPCPSGSTLPPLPRLRRKARA